MKRILILFIILITFFKSDAQKFESIFLGDDFLHYKGSFLKIKSDASWGFPYAFYEDLKYCKSAYDRNVIYPDTDPEHSFKTVKDSLFNRIFVVVDIVDIEGNIYKDTVSFQEKPIFILKDTTTKQVIYYKYDKNNKNSFPFSTSNIDLKKRIICAKIERKIDEFTGELKLNSPILINNRIARMIIYKEINKLKKISYFLVLSTIGKSVTVTGTGAIILFDDETKWSKEVKVEVKAGQNEFEYSVFINLTPKDLEIFSTKVIKKFRLYVFDQEIKLSDAEEFRLYVQCLKDLKR